MATEVLESLLDIRVFAERVLGEPLWPHQVEAALCEARTVALNCGRQAGKSRTLAVLALHKAFTRAGSRVLVLSAGEDSAKRLLSEMSSLIASPLLGGSVFDESKSEILLRNGSWIRCVPASEKQVRGIGRVNLLILDEAAQISDDLWRAARYTVIAAPDARIYMASTPFGSKEHFFAQAYQLGRDGAEGYRSFHWPSQVSPLVSDSLLQEWRRTDPEWVYRQEVLAEWVEDQQAYFRAEELLEAVADYEMWSPERCRELGAEGRLSGGAGGLDWGFAQDHSALAVMAPADDWGLNSGLVDKQQVWFLPYVEVSAARTRYADWAKRVAEVTKTLGVRVWASETNGPGFAAGELLRQQVDRLERAVAVAPVTTTNRRKQAGFGGIKVLLEQRRLVLPRHAELLRQLQALEFRYSETGQVQISVPERFGHDDAALALCQAYSCVNTWAPPPDHAERWGESPGPTITTSGGLTLPEQLRPLWNSDQYVQWPSGAQTDESTW